MAEPREEGTWPGRCGRSWHSTGFSVSSSRAGSVPWGAAGLLAWAEVLGSCLWEQPQLCRGCFVATAACPVCAQGGCWHQELLPWHPGRAGKGSRGQVRAPLKVRAQCIPGAGTHGWGPPEVSPWAVSPSQQAPHVVGAPGTAQAARVTQMAPLGFQGVFVPPQRAC